MKARSFEMYALSYCRGAWKQIGKRVSVMPSNSFEMYALSFYRGAWKQMGNCCQCSKQQLWDVRFELLSGCMKANWQRFLVLPNKIFEMYALSFCRGAWKHVRKGCECCEIIPLRCTLEAFFGVPFFGVPDGKLENVLSVPSKWFEMNALSFCRGAWKQIWKRLLVLPSNSFEMYVLSSCRGAWKQIGKTVSVLPSNSFEMYALSFCRGAWKHVGKGC